MHVRVGTAALLLVAGCSPAGVTGNGAAMPAPTASPSAAAPGPGALGARRLAQRYFDRLKAHDYRAAYRMWGGDGADTRGTLKDFIAANARFARYDGTAGSPTAPRVVGGIEYITVEAGADTRISGQATTVRRTGAVMLRRPVRAAGAPDDGGGWTIWGTDLRPRTCRAGQRAQAFGCV